MVLQSTQTSHRPLFLGIRAKLLYTVHYLYKLSVSATFYLAFHSAFSILLNKWHKFFDNQYFIIQTSRQFAPGKNHVSINFWSRVLGLRANSSSRWELQYCRAGLVHYTKYCCWKWLLKLNDFFLNISQASQTAKWPRNKQKKTLFLGRSVCDPPNFLSLTFFFEWQLKMKVNATRKKYN